MVQHQSMALQHGLMILLLGSIILYMYSLLFWRGSNSTVTGAPQLEESVSLSKEPKRFLVTGAAGFIGFHLARFLARDLNDLVIAVDNFNEYYDVKLKMDRAYELHKLGIQVYHEDICNTAFLEEVFMMYNFTHVAHMAAQAGVRYSLENPMAYVRANVECQISLMDVIAIYPHVKLVYASSSSVYGKKSAIPFTLSARTDQPGNMYAATKKTDEILAYHYCREYSLSMVGLRFFTVYGPWGRPDMAVFKFAQSILDDKPVPMFNSGGPTPLSRDFTYVDDVVSGVRAALDYIPSECGERFNLGFGHPVSVPHLVRILEQELQRTASVKKLPLPPSEILETWADISASTQLLGFNPTIDLTDGVQRFVKWYQGYLHQRAAEDASDQPNPAEQWFSAILDDKAARNAKYEVEATKKNNRWRMKRLQHKLDKYLSWLQNTRVGVLPVMQKDKFIFFQGMDSNGGDIIHASALKDNIKALEERCREVEECVAFNSNGLLKSSVKSQTAWVVAFDGQKQGLYVAELDMCHTDLHTCARYATCSSKGPARHTCRCHDGFYGDGHYCLPCYGEVPPWELHTEYMAQFHNLLNITQMKEGKEIVFFQGKDSPGGDYIVADKYKGKNIELQSLCRRDPICIGVTTTGMLKSRILSPDLWPTWTNKQNHGIYVFDINYCLLSEEPCPDHSTCQKIAPAVYDCMCDYGYVMESHECIQQPPVKTKPQL